MKRRENKLRIVLRVLRDAAEKNQTELGSKIHLDKNAISRIENGADVHPDVLLDWVRACGGISRIEWLVDSLQGLKQLVGNLSSSRDFVAYA